MTRREFYESWYRRQELRDRMLLAAIRSRHLLEEMRRNLKDIADWFEDREGQ